MSERERKQKPASNLRLFYSLFGALAGLFYAIGISGIDAFTLYFSNGMMPFYKFVPLVIICIVSSAIMGLISSFMRQMWFHLIIWSVYGYGISQAVQYFMFEWFNEYFARVNPQLLSQLTLGVDEGVGIRMNIVMIISIVVFGFAGMMISSFAEESGVSVYPAQRYGRMVLWCVIFVVAALIGDSFISKPLRDPLVMLDTIIEFQATHEEDEISDYDIRDMHLRSLRSVTEYLDLPRRMIVREYDRMMVAVKILVDFDGTLAECTMVNSQGSNCVLIESTS